jgi:hypothetical protein
MTIMMKKAATVIAAAIVLAGAGILGLGSSPAFADPPSCAPGSTKVKEGPAVHATNAGFTQKLTAFRCPSPNRQRFWGRVHVSPDAGFQPSHVIACTAHIGIAYDDGHDSNDETYDCLAAIRTGSPFEVAVIGWDFFLPGNNLHMTGYVNIRTGVGEKNTYAYASRTPSFNVGP